MKGLVSFHPKTPTLREAQALGDTDEKRNLLIHKLYDFAALCCPAVIRQRNYVSGRALVTLCLMLVSFVITANSEEIKTTDVNQQNQTKWQKSIDDFAKADPQTVITPYMQIINQLNGQPDFVWCQPNAMSLVNQAVKLNPSSLIAHSILYTCAAKAHKSELRKSYRETLNGLIAILVDTAQVDTDESVIEIRELMEAPLLLQAMGYTVLDANLVTRYGGLYYQYFVLDTHSSKVTSRYFSNLRFMKNLLSNPNVSDNTAARLITQYYQEQELPLAITLHAKRLVAEKRYQEAEALLATVQEYSMTKNLLLAQIYYDENRHQDLDALQKALSLDAKYGYTAAAIMLAKIKLNQAKGEGEESVAQLLAKVDKFTKDGEGAYKLAMSLQADEKSRQSSFTWFELAANKNHPEATLALARLYRQGDSVKVDHQKAFKLFKTAKRLGLSQAGIEIARYYHTGNDLIPADHDKEIALLRQLALQKNATASYMLGQRYRLGEDVDIDLHQAMSWYTAAYEQGHTRAANQIGLLVEFAKLEPKADLPQAFSWYQKAGEKGDSNGFSNMGRFYQYGKGRSVDLQQAADNYIKSAETGSNIAYCKLADIVILMGPKEGETLASHQKRAKGLYQYGVKYEKRICARKFGFFYQHQMNEPQSAMQWYELAASNGDKAAKDNLEVLYFAAYVKKNYQQAFANFNKGQKLGMVQSTYFLGELFHQGKGVTRDDNKALLYFRQASAGKYPDAEKAIIELYLTGESGVRDRQKAIILLNKIANRSTAHALNLAQSFYYAKGVTMDYELARMFYLIAAQNDNGIALNHLGEIHRYGQGVPVDFVKASDYYMQAINVEHKLAIFNIAQMHYNGEGRPINYAEALTWFKKASDKEVSYAQYYLGLMFQQGHGVKQNFKQANQWLYLAMDQQHQGAKFILAKNMLKGKGMVKNVDRAMLYITECAEANYQQAIDFLANTSP
jgi:TPR repeat protein